jgi:hypothetical protein
MKLDLPPGYNAHTFRRIRDNGDVAIFGIDSGLGWSFRLNDIPDFGDFTALYDAYTIDRVEITYILHNVAPGQFPTLFWAPDYDDDNTPLSVNSVTTHQNVRWHAFSENARSVTMSVDPRSLVSTYQAGVTSAYSWAKGGAIVDMANPAVPFYGIKTWLSNYNTVLTPGARIQSILTYHIRCIGQR